MSAPTTLFDAPGPKARSLYRIAAIVVGVLVLALLWLAVARLADKGQLTSAKWSPVFDPVVWRSYILPGLMATLTAAAISVVTSAVFGVVFGLGRLSHNRIISALSGTVVEFFRSVPVLVMMTFAYWTYSYQHTFGSNTAIVPLAAVITGLTPYNGSVIAELIRAGVHALPKGQAEAGLSIGLTPQQTLRAIQLPQALTAMLPALISQLVVVLKDTALGYQILYIELLRQSSNAGTTYTNIVPMIFVAAVLYILLNLGLTQVAAIVERRLNRSKHTAAPIAHAQPATVTLEHEQPGEILAREKD